MSRRWIWLWVLCCCVVGYLWGFFGAKSERHVGSDALTWGDAVAVMDSLQRHREAFVESLRVRSAKTSKRR